MRHVAVPALLFMSFFFCRIGTSVNGVAISKRVYTRTEEFWVQVTCRGGGMDSTARLIATLG
jgi:hypothetical protein